MGESAPATVFTEKGRSAGLVSSWISFEQTKSYSYFSPLDALSLRLQTSWQFFCCGCRFGLVGWFVLFVCFCFNHVEKGMMINIAKRRIE